MTLTYDERIEYFKRVWANFQKLAGTKREPSNAEWDMARKWAVRGIPLAVVLQGISESAKPEARTILYCEKAVEANIERWAKAVGGLKQLPESGPLEEPEFDAEAAKKRKAELLAKLRAS